MPINPTHFTDDGKLHDEPFANSKQWSILEITHQPSSLYSEKPELHLQQFADICTDISL